jgi:hypothetical protein
VFDVSYENQGAEDAAASTLSATDIKVCVCVCVCVWGWGWGGVGGGEEGFLGA